MHDLTKLLADALLATPSDAIVAADRDGVIRFWNPGAERIFGFSESEAVGQTLEMIVPEKHRKRHWEGYDKVMATGESRYGRGDLLAVPALRNGGATISVEFTILPLHDADGTIAGFGAVMRDVTRRFNETRELRKQLAAAQCE
jgi:PAS domain S-box-containing protein